MELWLTEKQLYLSLPGDYRVSFVKYVCFIMVNDYCVLFHLCLRQNVLQVHNSFYLLEYVGKWVIRTLESNVE
jgi:hypothetical protein